MRTFEELNKYHCDQCGVFGTEFDKGATGLDLLVWMNSTGWGLIKVDNSWKILCAKCLILVKAYKRLKG